MQLNLHLGDTTAVAETLGGELISWRGRDNTEYIWTGDPAFWSGRSPVLFPAVCAIRDGKTIFDGVSYEMAKHGFARKNEFSILKSTDSAVTFELKDSAETLKSFPYHFSLQITHTLEENGFRTDYRVECQDKKPMVFCIGGHTGFRCPLKKGTTFEEYELLFDAASEVLPYYTDSDGFFHRGDPSFDGPALEYGNRLPLRYADFERDALVFEDLHSRKVTMSHKSEGPVFEFRFEGFPALGVWTPPQKNAPFLCLEPWTGLGDDYNASGVFADKRYAVTLKPGEVFTASYAMTAL